MKFLENDQGHISTLQLVVRPRTKVVLRKDPVVRSVIELGYQPHYSEASTLASGRTFYEEAIEVAENKGMKRPSTKSSDIDTTLEAGNSRLGAEDVDAPEEEDGRETKVWVDPKSFKKGK